MSCRQERFVESLLWLDPINGDYMAKKVNVDGSTSIMRLVDGEGTQECWRLPEGITVARCESVNTPIRERVRVSPNTTIEQVFNEEGVFLHEYKCIEAGSMMFFYTGKEYVVCKVGGV
jgi:hypothetical protein